MTKPLLIIGAGGHAKVLIESLLRIKALIAGVLDANPTMVGTTVLGVPVLGGDELVMDFPQDEIRLVNGIGSVGPPVRHRELFERFKGMGYGFATIIHPAAVVALDVELGEGAQVMAGAVLQPGTRVGCNAIVNTKASADHDCRIGDHSHVAPGVTLSGGVIIGESCHIGTGATVIQYLEIGSHSLVAAGALVVSNVAAGTTVRGVPAREIPR